MILFLIAGGVDGGVDGGASVWGGIVTLENVVT